MMSAIPDPASSFEEATSKSATSIEGRDPKTGQFLKGVRGVGGRKRGSRVKLVEDVVADVLESWRRDGPAALARVACLEPGKYLDFIAKVLPKEVKMEVTSNLTDIPDDILAVMLEQAEAKVAAMKTIEGVAVDVTPKALPVPTFSIAPLTEAAQRAEAKRLDLIDQSDATNAAAPVLPSQAIPHPVGRPFPRPDHEVERRNRAKLTAAEDIDPASLF